jgi:hypothetical protein
MTVALSGSGGLFTRLGRLFAGADDIQALRGATATSRVLTGANWVTRAATILADYAAGTGIQATADGLYSNLSAWQGTSTAFLTALKSLAQATVVRMVDLDVGLPVKDLPNALAVLNAQMRAAAASINASVPSVANPAAIGTPYGNPAIVVSLKNAAGETLQYVVPENLVLTCTGDSRSGATAGQEPLSLKGAAATADSLAYNWPTGSGASLNFKDVDGTKSNSGGNLLQSADFEVWSTANTPDNFVISAGAAGTDVFNGGSGNAYGSGTGSLQFTGPNGAVTQQFGIPVSTSPGAGGTPATFSGGVQYSFNGWAKVSATPTAGALDFALVDGAGTVINDDSASANLVTQSLTAFTGAWVAVNGTFRTPTVLPAVQKIRIRPTGLDAGKSVYLDRLALAIMAPAYQGGPSINVFSGSNKLILNDAWSIAIGQTWGALAKHLQRNFALREMGLQIPASATPTLPDSLIA